MTRRARTRAHNLQRQRRDANLEDRLGSLESRFGVMLNGFREQVEREPPLRDLPPIAPRDTPTDRLGRGQLRPFDTLPWVLRLAARDGRVREVPGAKVVEEREDEALVECPCGHRPIVERTLRQCPGCQRWYILMRRVWVVYADMPVPGGQIVLSDKEALVD